MLKLGAAMNSQGHVVVYCNVMKRQTILALHRIGVIVIPMKMGIQYFQ